MTTTHETAFKKADLKGALLVPITFGPTRLRGKTEGPLVEDDALAGGPLEQLRKQLAIEAQASGVDPDDSFINTCILQLLGIFAKGYAEYRLTRTDEIGFVYEGTLPSGRAVVMAQTLTLNRLCLAS